MESVQLEEKTVLSDGILQMLWSKDRLSAEYEHYSLLIECERSAAPEDDSLRLKHVVLYIYIH
jgi:hypothetical protein